MPQFFKGTDSQSKHLKLLGLPPLLFSGTLLIFYLQVTLILGRLPLTNGYDDPGKFFGSALYGLIIFMSYLAGMMLAPLFVIIGTYYWIKPKEKSTRLFIVTVVLIYIAAIALARSDIGVWFWD